MKSILNTKHQKVLQEFIKAFLPKTGEKRKTTGNEIDYIHSTLDRIFVQHFGFNLTASDIMKAFDDLDYQTFLKGASFDYENKTFKPSKKGDITLIRGNSRNPSNPIVNFIYIEVSAKSVRSLRKTTAALPKNTNQAKLSETALLLKEICHFKSKH